MLKVLPPVTAYTDFERVIKPFVCDFADAMCSRFAGSEVLPEVVVLFLNLTDTNNYEAAASWLYEVRTVEQMRRVEQHRRAKLQGSANA